MLLLNRLSNINSQIDSYQAQISELQLLITDLQSHAQEVQGAEQAANSAIVQIRTALEMLTAICPDEIVTFKTAINGLFDNPNPLKLVAAVDDDAITTVQPVAPNPPVDDEPLEVESTPLVEPQLEEAQEDAPKPSAEVVNHNDKAASNGYSLLATEDELKKCDRPKLVKLANKHQISGYQNKTRDKLAELLTGRVTTDELTPPKTLK